MVVFWYPALPGHRNDITQKLNYSLYLYLIPMNGWSESDVKQRSNDVSTCHMGITIYLGCQLKAKCFSFLSKKKHKAYDSKYCAFYHIVCISCRMYYISNIRISKIIQARECHFDYFHRISNYHVYVHKSEYFVMTICVEALVYLKCVGVFMCERRIWDWGSNICTRWFF